jgi:starch phosphorylase
MNDPKIDAALINRLIDEEIIRYWNTEPEKASLNQIYRAFSIVIRDLLLRKRNKFKKMQNEDKQVFYICMEFLIGKSLRNNLFNLGIEDEAEESLKK